MSVGDSASDSATSPTSVLPDCANCAACEMFSPRMSFGSHAVVQPLVTQRRHRGATVRRMLGVRDRHPTDARIGHHRQATPHVDAGISARPQHEAARRVLVQRAALGLTRPFEPPRVVDVRGQKDVEWRAVLDLREEVAGRAEREPDRLSRVLFELATISGSAVCRSDAAATARPLRRREPAGQQHGDGR